MFFAHKKLFQNRVYIETFICPVTDLFFGGHLYLIKYTLKFTTTIVRFKRAQYSNVNV